MKHLTKYFSLFLITSLNINVCAQDSTKAKLGSHVGFYFSGDICDQTSEDYLPKFGYQAGVTYAKGLSRIFSLGTGLAYTRFAYHEDVAYYYFWSSVPSERNIYHYRNYLEVPVFMQFTFGKSEKVKVDIKFGPTVTALMKSGEEGIVKGENQYGILYESNVSFEQSAALLGKNHAHIYYSLLLFAGVHIKVSDKMYLTIHSSNRYYPAYYHYYYFRSSHTIKAFSTGLAVGINYKLN